MIEGWIIWLLLGAILIVAEVFVPGFVLFPIGVGALAGSILAYLGFGTGVQWLVFGLVSVMVAVLAWKIIARSSKKETRGANIEQLFGKQAVVIEKIDPELGVGRIRVGQEVWRAISKNNSAIEEQEKVRISDVSGTQLIVEIEE